MSTDAGRAEPVTSMPPSSFEASTLDNEKLAATDQPGNGLSEVEGREGPDVVDEREDTAFLPQQTEKPEPPKSNFLASLAWMVVNTLATIGIVRALVP